jgi:hypothetical protein
MNDYKSPDSVKEEGDRPSGDIVGECETYTPEEEKAVLRKIDMVILPFVRCLGHFFNPVAD